MLEKWQECVEFRVKVWRGRKRGRERERERKYRRMLPGLFISDQSTIYKGREREGERKR